MAIELYSFSVNRDNCIQIINSINISIAVIIADIDGTPINTLPGTTCVEVAISWDQSISDEFLITHIAIDNGLATHQAGNYHNDSTLVTSIKNDYYDGEANIYTHDNIKVATFTYEKGVANGTCTFYHRSGKLSFQGYLKNGYRYGIGVEYTEEGEVIYKGVFKDGHRYPHISKRADDSDLWYERDQYGNLKATDHKVENGLNHGNCFFYE